MNDEIVYKLGDRTLIPTGHLRFIQKKDGVRFLQNLYQDRDKPKELIWMDIPLEFENEKEAKTEIVDGDRPRAVGGNSDNQQPKGMAGTADADLGSRGIICH